MNWRRWIYQKLIGSTAITTLVPETSIYAAGSLDGSPAKRPFIVLRVNDESAELNDGDAPLVTGRFAEVWVYDEPGSYDKIDAVLVAVREVLVGNVTDATGIFCQWQGDSTELSDDAFNAIMRNGSFRLLGVVA